MERPLRILYSHRIASRDGQSVHVEELVGALRGAGHEVRVVGPSVYDASDFGGESRLVARLRARMPGWLNELAELTYNLPAYLRLRRACRSFAPDLVYERYNLYYLAGLWLARRRGLPLYLEVNAPIADERARYSGLRLVRLARALEARVWRSADRVLAVTEVLKATIAAAGADAARIEVVPNGIDPRRFAGPHASAREAGESGGVVLGFVGFVRAWHGLAGVIDAMAAEPKAAALKLVVVGDGPARAELEGQASALGLGDRVAFLGLAERETVPGLVAGFDIALQPQVVAYASPLKVFEYMAAGRAIVAPDQPNIREILTHCVTALLFDPAEPGAMWAAIQRLVQDPALRARLGAAACADIARRDYTWRRNAERVASLARADIARRVETGARFAVALLVVAALATPRPACATSIAVGPHRLVTLPSQAALIARDGDTIAIDPGDYVDCAVWRAQNLRIEGSGPGVVIRGRVCEDKALFVTEGNDITVANVTLLGARSSSRNGAGIRAEGRNLTVTETTFIDDENGILSTDSPASSIHITDSEFRGDGSCAAECAHGIYAGRIRLLRVERSLFADTRQGHHIKSRARETEIVGNVIKDGPDGTASYLIDVPNGGVTLIEGNRMEKGPRSENTRVAISVGAEGVTNPTLSIVVRNNHFTNDETVPTVFVRNMTAASARLIGNELRGDVLALQGPGDVR